MNPFVKFMASMNGRIARIVIGIALIVWGFLGASTIVAVIGFVPLLAGLFDIYLFAPLFGNPLSGSKIRGDK